MTDEVTAMVRWIIWYQHLDNGDTRCVILAPGGEREATESTAREALAAAAQKVFGA